jgi:hypothetical protein
MFIYTVNAASGLPSLQSLSDSNCSFLNRQDFQTIGAWFDKPSPGYFVEVLLLHPIS